MPAKIHENAMKVFEARYLAKEFGEKDVDQIWRRCSDGNPEFYELLSELYGLPNSPTLMNMGLNNGCTLSACFVFNIDDTMRDGPRSISATQDKAMAVAKAGGGVGYYFGNLRRKGAPIRSVHREACGPVAVLKHYHSIRNLIKQGARRDLAQMGVLNADHEDIYDWIHCKDEDPKALESFNISVSWKNKMLKEVEWDRFGHKWWLKKPGDGEITGATALWVDQCHSAHRTGDPGMLFWDTINAGNKTPWLGTIEATNPCGETPNLNDEPCNLGSLNLAKFLHRLLTNTKKFKLDWDKLKEFVRRMTRYLDHILDVNVFPHPDIDRMARHTRKLGLGPMGLADMLALLHIPYDSQEAVDLSGEVAKVFREEAASESARMAESKGPYPAWEIGEKKVEYAGRFPKSRNSTNLSVAPTGTISLLAHCSSSIEPHYALEWDRTTNEGIKLKERIPVWEDLGTFVPKVANEIGLEWHVKHQAAWQKHTDLGVSKTINLPNSATVKDVSDAYRLMWETGCKGGTIYRDGCRHEQVLVAKDKSKSSVYTTDLAVPEKPAKRRLPDDVLTHRHKFKVGGTKCYLHVGMFEDGTPGEIFLRVAQQGSTADGMFNTFAVAVSAALQEGTNLDELVRRHAGSRFEPHGFTGKELIPNCTSIPDYVVRYLKAKFGEQTKIKLKDKAENRLVEIVKSSGTGSYCPDCSTELIQDGGKCLRCPKTDCGFSKC